LNQQISNIINGKTELNYKVVVNLINHLNKFKEKSFVFIEPIGQANEWMKTNFDSLTKSHSDNRIECETIINTLESSFDRLRHSDEKITTAVENIQILLENRHYGHIKNLLFDLNNDIYNPMLISCIQRVLIRINKIISNIKSAKNTLSQNEDLMQTGLKDIKTNLIQYEEDNIQHKERCIQMSQVLTDIINGKTRLNHDVLVNLIGELNQYNEKSLVFIEPIDQANKWIRNNFDSLIKDNRDNRIKYNEIINLFSSALYRLRDADKEIKSAVKIMKSLLENRHPMDYNQTKELLGNLNIAIYHPDSVSLISRAILKINAMITNNNLDGNPSENPSRKRKYKRIKPVITKSKKLEELSQGKRIILKPNNYVNEALQSTNSIPNSMPNSINQRTEPILPKLKPQYDLLYQMQTYGANNNDKQHVQLKLTDEAKQLINSMESTPPQIDLLAMSSGKPRPVLYDTNNILEPQNYPSNSIQQSIPQIFNGNEVNIVPEHVFNSNIDFLQQLKTEYEKTQVNLLDVKIHNVIMGFDKVMSGTHFQSFYNSVEDFKNQGKMYSKEMERVFDIIKNRRNQVNEETRNELDQILREITLMSKSLTRIAKNIISVKDKFIRFMSSTELLQEKATEMISLLNDIRNTNSLQTLNDGIQEKINIMIKMEELLSII